jgi:nicotinamide mononucleotide transporter
MTAVELIGTITGLWCVWLAYKEKVSNWPIGIVNIVFFAVLFWQVQLYSDFLLQFYFLVVTFIGWWAWTHPKPGFEKNKNELKITTFSKFQLSLYSLQIVMFTLIWGKIISGIHLWMPSIFPVPASYPYWDALTTVMSLYAVVWLAKKKLESWILWITADAIDCIIYFKKGVMLVSIEYVIFGVIATLGLIAWTEELKRQDSME